jgi:MFS family permease
VADGEGDGHPSLRFGQGLTAVVPTKAVQESLRGFRRDDLLQDDEEDGTAIFDPMSSSCGQLPRRDWTSFVVIYTMIFFNGCCFTAVVPSVPFYLEQLGAAPSFLGWVVSFYSLGQFVGSPTAGWLADRLSSQRMLTMSSTLGFFSSTLYAVAPTYWFVLASRILTGVSAGMEFTTELAYIARNTTEKERTTFLASVTAVNVIGFILGPALTTILSTLDFTVFGLAVNQYTSPGWLLVLMFLVDIVMVQTLFRDSIHQTKNGADIDDVENGGGEESKLLKGYDKNKGYAGAADRASLRSTQKDSFNDNAYVSFSEAPPSSRMVVSLIFVQFTAMCAWSVLETITSPIVYTEFGWNVQACNILFTCGGFVSLLAYVGFVVASKWVEDRKLIVFALAVCFIGLMLMIDWPDLWFAPTWISMPSYVYRFVIGYFVLNAGFMTARPVTFALYSKLIEPQHQGRYLGFMVAGGSAARMAGPFVAVYLYYGITEPTGLNMLALFGSEALFQLICTGLVLVLWPELLPSSSSRRRKELDTITSHSGPGIEMEEG